MQRPSLFGRYWLTLALVTTLPLLAAGAIETWVVYQSNYQTTLERQVLEARQSAFLIERSVMPPIDRLRMIADLPWNYPTATPAEWTADIRRLIRQYPLIERVQRITPAGEVYGFFAQDGLARTPPANEAEALAAFSEVRVEKRQVPLLIRREGRTSWSVAFMERGTGNRLVADLRTDVVNDLVRSTTATDGNVTFVADRNGAILAHPDLSLVYGGKSLPDLAGWSLVPGLAAVFARDAKPEGSLGELDVQISADPQMGKQWFAAYRRMPDLDWTVFAVSPSARLRAAMRDAMLRTILILLSANALALLVAWALAKRMSQPIASLAKASQRVAQGDLTARAEVTSDNDVGQLAVQFNRMVGELNQSYAELEAKVADKTAALELANRHKSEFLAQMSHELRTPLNAVIGFSDALRAQYFGPLNDKQVGYVRNIHASGQHLLALINDLLDLAKIEAGRVELVLAPVDIPTLIESSLELVRGRAQAQGVTLHEHIASDVTAWVADGRKLKQILVNLLTNAVKFTRTGGKVDVTVELVGTPAGSAVASGTDQAMAGLRFRVDDTGVGIPPDQVARLFTEYGQLRHEDEATREGTGRGLALSPKLAQLHGTTIAVQSEPGRGSSFSFTLPARVWPTT